jgi:branched-chain amino acid transport system permease protein
MGLTLAIGIATGCVYALVAVGYSLIYRTTGVVNFAQGSYVMLGGFATWWFFAVAGLPYPLAIAAGIGVAGLIGLALWTLVVLPLWRRRSPPYVVLLATIVFGAIIGNATLLLLGTLPQTLPPWVPGLQFEWQGNRIDGQYGLIIVASLLSLCAFGALLRFSQLGRAMRACAASRETSQLLGISPERTGALCFVATAALGGFGGAMITPAQFTSSDVGLAYGVFGFVAAVLGGFGSLLGALTGGVLLGLVNALIGRYISSNYQTVIAFAILLILLAVRPQGIVGRQWEDA